MTASSPASETILARPWATGFWFVQTRSYADTGPTIYPDFMTADAFALALNEYEEPIDRLDAVQAATSIEIGRHVVCFV